MMHLLLLFVSRISLYTCMLQPIGLQSSDMYVHYYYGDGVAQGFVWWWVGAYYHNWVGK